MTDRADDTLEGLLLGGDVDTGHPVLGRRGLGGTDGEPVDLLVVDEHGGRTRRVVVVGVVVREVLVEHFLDLCDTVDPLHLLGERVAGLRGLLLLGETGGLDVALLGASLEVRDLLLGVVQVRLGVGLGSVGRLGDVGRVGRDICPCLCDGVVDGHLVTGDRTGVVGRTTAREGSGTDERGEAEACSAALDAEHGASSGVGTGRRCGRGDGSGRGCGRSGGPGATADAVAVARGLEVHDERHPVEDQRPENEKQEPQDGLAVEVREVRTTPDQDDDRGDDGHEGRRTARAEEDVADHAEGRKGTGEDQQRRRTATEQGQDVGLVEGHEVARDTDESGADEATEQTGVGGHGEPLSWGLELLSGD